MNILEIHASHKYTTVVPYLCHKLPIHTRSFHGHTSNHNFYWPITCLYKLVDSIQILEKCWIHFHFHSQFLSPLYGHTFSYLLLLSLFRKILLHSLNPTLGFFLYKDRKNYTHSMHNMCHSSRILFHFLYHLVIFIEKSNYIENNISSNK